MSMENEHTSRPGQRIWVVGSGKGGVGKSLVSVSLAILLANIDQTVVAVDLDLGNANMHTGLGIKYPGKTIIDFFKGDIDDLNEIMLDTPIYNLKLISGSGGVVGASNPIYTQKMKLIRYLEKLYVDNLVLDLGAGTSFNTIDFFLGGTDHVLVMTPDITSVQGSYNFIRITVFRKLQAIFQKNAEAQAIVERAKVPAVGEVFSIGNVLEQLEGVDPEGVAEAKRFLEEFRPHLLMNMVMKDEEVKLGAGVAKVMHRYLSVNARFSGGIAFDAGVRDSLAAGVPHLINALRAKSSQNIVAMAPRLLGNSTNTAYVTETVQRGLRRAAKSYTSRIVESASMNVDPSVYAVDRIKSEESGEHDTPQGGFFGFAGGSWSKIAIDLGTTNTLIFVKGRGVILNEPSLMSVEEETGKLVALGLEAKAMTGRAHSGIKIVSPLASGAITDYSDVKIMIQEYIRRAKRSVLLIRPGVVLTVQPGLTSVEKRAFHEFIRELGAREVHLVYEPMAAAIGAGLPVDMPKATMLVNIGGGSISAMVISISGVVGMSSARVGGNVVDTHIQRYLREEHSFMVGEQTAEWIKINFGQASKLGRDHRFDVRGLDIAQGIPRTISVSTAEIRQAIANPVTKMLKVVLDLLERVPPELSGDLVDRGMTLTGGGAYLKGIDKLIIDRTGIAVRIAPNAKTATVEGAGRMLDDLDAYRRFFIENADLQE